MEAAELLEPRGFGVVGERVDEEADVGAGAVADDEEARVHAVRQRARDGRGRHAVLVEERHDADAALEDVRGDGHDRLCLGRDLLGDDEDALEEEEAALAEARRRHVLRDLHLVLHEHLPLLHHRALHTHKRRLQLCSSLCK